MSRAKYSFINLLSSTTSRFLNIMCNFILRTILIKTLGEQYSGVVSLFTDILTVLSFAELGIGSAITFELYKPLSEKNDRRVALLMKFYRNAYFMVAGSIFFIGIILIPFLYYIVTDVPDIKENIKFIYFLYLINSVVSYTFIYKSTLLIASQKKFKISLIEIVFNLFKTLLQILTLFIWGNLTLFLVISIVNTILQNITITIITDKEYRFLKQYTGKIEKEDRIKILKDIKALGMYKIAGSILNGTDSVIISMFVNTIMVGLVANYKLLINGIDTIVQQFFLAVEPSVGNLVAEKGNERQYEVFLIIQFISFCICNFCCVCFVMLFDPFVTIWLGYNYILPYSAVLMMVANFYITMMIRPIAMFRTTNGLFIQGQFRPVIMSVLNIIISVILAINFGVSGVLAGTILARIMTQLWYDPMLVYKKVFNLPISSYWNQYFNYLFETVFSCIVCVLIKMIIIFENIYAHFIYSCIICCTLPILLIFIRYKNTEEFKNVQRIIIKLYSSRK